MIDPAPRESIGIDAPHLGQEIGGCEGGSIRTNYSVALNLIRVKSLQGLIALIELATYLPFSKRFSFLLDRLQLAKEALS
jgi:hypothetical protein